MITRVALDKHRDAEDTSKPYLALQRNAERTFVAQAGLIGEGLPNHRTVYEPLPGPRALAAGNDELRLKLQATAANGDKVVQVLTFHRGSYVIDVAFDVTNAGTAPITPEAYFQLMRDTKHVGVQSSMAPASFVGPVVYNDQDKFKKVDFGEIDKEAADPSRKPAYTQATDNGWIGMIEHYFVDRLAAARDGETPARSSTRRSSTTASTPRACAMRKARSRPAPRARSMRGCTSVRRTRMRSPSSRRASTSSSTTASSRSSRRRCSCCSSGCIR